MKRYTEISTVRKPLYTGNAPLLVRKVSVFYDSEEKRRIVLCKIQNLSEKTIKSANVLLKFYDKEGHNLGDGLEYEYQDLCVYEGYTFGEKILIKTNIKGVYKAIALVKDVVFDDGSGWKADENAKSGFLKPPTSIAKTLKSNYQLCGYKNRFGNKARFAYEERQGVKICTCGALNGAHRSHCLKCGIDFSELINLDFADLNCEGYYISAENALSKKCDSKRLFRLRAAFEKLGNYKNSKEHISEIDDKLSEIKKRKAKAKKRTIRLSIAATALSIITVLTITIFVPWIRMLVADSYFEDGQYDDALSIYDDIDGFSRSEKSATAVRAIKKLEDNLVEDAIKMLLSAGIPVQIHYDYNFENSTASSGESEAQIAVLSAAAEQNNNFKDALYKSLSDFRFDTPKKTGYSLNEWKFVSQSYDPSDKKGSFNLSLKASWVACDYTVTFEDVTKALDGVTVTFDYNYDGCSQPKDVYVANGEMLSYPQLPVREGYIFVGWYTNSECTEKYGFSGSINDDLTLFAKWIEPSSAYAFDEKQLDPKYYYYETNTSYRQHSVSTRYTSYNQTICRYVLAEEDGEHTIWFRNSSSYSYDAYQLYIYNMTDNTVIKEKTKISSTGYNRVTFNCSAGDVIVIEIYKTSNSYYDYSTAYLCFEGFSGIESSAKAECNYQTEYKYKADENHTQTVTFDKSFVLINVSRRGYAFLGWYNNETKFEAGIWNRTTNITLTPKWAPCDNTITLDANGGVVSQSTIGVKYDAEFTLPIPTRDGYTFEGWYLENEKYENGVWLELNDITLSAKWKANEYVITLNDTALSATVVFDSNYIGANTTQVVLKNGETLSYPLPPTRTGYVFTGWYTDSDCTSRFDFTEKITEDMTLYAGWLDMSMNYVYTENQIDPTDYTSSSNCYSIYTGSTSSNYRNHIYIVANEAGTHKIYWKNSDSYYYYGYYLQIYNLTSGMSLRSSSNTYSTSYQNVSFTCDKGDVIVISFYRYDSYSSTAYFYFEGFNSVTSSAVASLNGFDFVEGSSFSENVTYDADYTLPALTREGYKFLGWYNNGNKVESGVWKYTSNISLTPMWEKLVYYKVELANTTPVYNDVVVTWDYNYSGSTGAQTTLAYGDVLSDLKVPLRSGYVFTGWYTDKNCNNRYGFSGIIEKDMTLYAGWVKKDTEYSYSAVQINPANYSSSSNPYSMSTSYTYSNDQNRIYLVAEEEGTHRICWKNSSSSYYYGYYLQIYNVTQNSVIRSQANTYSTSYSNVSFICSAGDVIEISFYRYDSYYSATAYFYFEGFGELQTSSAVAKETELVDYKYNEGSFSIIEVAYGEGYVLPTLTREGYTFLGWYNGNTKVDSGTWNIASDVTLTPHWQYSL